MELDLLPYLAARMALVDPPEAVMATLISPELAVTASFAVSRLGLSEGRRDCWLDFFQSPKRAAVKVTVEGDDSDVDFAVLKLEKPLELPTTELVLSAEPVREYAAWESLAIGLPFPSGIRIDGRVEGIVFVENRSLLKLSVNNWPGDIFRFSGAPVMVGGKVVGIIGGLTKSAQSSGTSYAYWYAVPVSEMIKSKATNAIRELLNLPEPQEEAGASAGAEPETPSQTDEIKALLARLGDNSSEVRVAAVNALGTEMFKEPDVRRAVAGLIDDPNKSVRAAALRALTEVMSYDNEIRAAAIMRLEDRSSEVRVAAVLALASLADIDDEVKRALVGKTTDHNSGVRTAAVSALKPVAATDEAVKSVLDSSTPGTSVESEGGSPSPTETDDPSASQAAATTAPVSAEPDTGKLFGRLSPSARRAIRHALGMSSLVWTNYQLGRRNSGELSQEEYDVAVKEPPFIPLEYLIAGLFENEGGPTRRLFLGMDVDDSKLAALAAPTFLPPRTQYAPVKFEELPYLAPETTRAMLAARDKADEMKAPQIDSRYLLYGALSIKENKLVTQLAEAGIRQEDVPLTDAPAPAMTAQTIARLNSDNAEGEDLLDITPDVNALSSVIAARDVATPLSIGLFGDWGSGKSFFMGKMRGQIKEFMDTARKARGQSAYCDNVVQIEFNAWSYQEGDLWASLITDIFEGLAKSIDDDLKLSEGTDPATAKARLLASMASARDVLAEQERKLVAAEKELQAGEKQFETLKKIGTKDVIREAYRVIVEEPEVKERLDAAAEQLHIPEAERALGDLQIELLGIKNTWSAFRLAFKGWSRPRDWIIPIAVLGGIALLIWGAVPLLLRLKVDAAIAWVGTLIPPLLVAGKRLAPVLKQAGKAAAIIKKIRKSHEQKLQEAKEKQQAQALKKLDDAQLRVKQAKENLKNVQQSLEDMRADKQLLDFVRQRSLSTDYTSQLGTVARARRDFKRLSDLMEEARKEHQAKGTKDEKTTDSLELPRIDRIVLYIDDLDRCSEDKVVKVLEAVHLLLAFKLFVVIVAVDSRWLLHSLRQHSTAFKATTKGPGISDEEDTHWESTPLNYLEKIFQIPFYLRPMRARGFDRLVHSVIGDVLSESAPDTKVEKTLEIAKIAKPDAIAGARQQATQKTSQSTEAENTKAMAASTVKAASSVTLPPIAADAAGAASTAAEIATTEATAADLKSESSAHPDKDKPGAGIQAKTDAAESGTKRERMAPAADANPAALQLRDWEREFMAKLHPLIMSPRSAKRFINIYRLMRVSITNERDLAAFVGNKRGGQHRAALLLLAILTGYPAEATDILRDLLEEERPETWWQYVDGLEARWKDPLKSSSGSGSINRQRRRDLMDNLRSLRGEIPEAQSCDQFVKWASKVARYSFESGRVLMILKDESDSETD